MAADRLRTARAETQVSRRDFVGRAIALLTGGAVLARPRRAAAAVAVSPVPYVGELRMFGGNFAPAGWALCDGQVLSIASNSALYGVIGTAFGGDGVTTFALPDLRGRVPLQPGQGVGLSNRSLGEAAGVETHTLSMAQMPSHTHTLRASASNGISDSPVGHVLGRSAAAIPQFGSGADTDLSAAAVVPSGGGQPHNNMQPFLTITYIIALQGDPPTP
jgi:microcystin-dependent protein